MNKLKNTKTERNRSSSPYSYSLFLFRSQRGMTLAEILVSISILVVIMISIAAFQYDVLNYNRSASVALTNSQEVQSILKTMTRELRSMEAGSNGAYPIAAAATSSITFFADGDGDGLKDQIRYYMNGTTLSRGVIKPTGSPLGYTGTEATRVMATGVRNVSSAPLFEYFNAAYSGTTAAMGYPLTITSIRLVKINLAIDTDPNKSPIIRSFSTQAALRNLKDNL